MASRLCVERPELSSWSSEEKPGAMRMSMAPAKLAISMTAASRSTAQLQKRSILSSHRVADGSRPLSVRQCSKYFQNFVVLLLLYVHAAVRFCQQFFSIHSVFRIDGAAHAQREPFHAAD